MQFRLMSAFKAVGQAGVDKSAVIVRFTEENCLLCIEALGKVPLYPSPTHQRFCGKNAKSFQGGVPEKRV